MPGRVKTALRAGPRAALDSTPESTAKQNSQAGPPLRKPAWVMTSSSNQESDQEGPPAAFMRRPMRPIINRQALPRTAKISTTAKSQRPSLNAMNTDGIKANMAKPLPAASTEKRIRSRQRVRPSLAGSWLRKGECRLRVFPTEKINLLSLKRSFDQKNGILSGSGPLGETPMGKSMGRPILYGLNHSGTLEVFLVCLAVDSQAFHINYLMISLESTSATTGERLRSLSFFSCVDYDGKSIVFANV